MDHFLTKILIINVQLSSMFLQFSANISLPKFILHEAAHVSKSQITSWLQDRLNVTEADGEDESKPKSEHTWLYDSHFPRLLR